MVNDSAVALMISIGLETSLFDTMASIGPANSDRIAQAARLNERYVREWLGAMVTGRVAQFDPARGTYWLPREQAAALTSTDGAWAISAELFRWLMHLMRVHDRMVVCYRDGKGLPYELYGDFLRQQLTHTAKRLERILIADVLPIVDGLPERLDRGIDVADVSWDTPPIHLIVPPGTDPIQRWLLLLASTYQRSRFAGFFFSDSTAVSGRAEATARGLQNVQFEVHGHARPPADAFDFIITFMLHDEAQPEAFLREIFRALRPDGTYLLIDVAASSRLEENEHHPRAPYLYTYSSLSCVPQARWYGGDGLGTVWGAELATKMLREAGFAKVTLHQIEADLGNTYYVARK